MPTKARAKRTPAKKSATKRASPKPAKKGAAKRAAPVAKKTVKKAAKKSAKTAKKAAAPSGRIVVENVNVPGYKTTVDAAKYATTRAAFLSVLPARSPGLTQAEMIEATAERLVGELREKAGWWVKSVQLDLEAKKLVVREKTKPLRWHKA